MTIDKQKLKALAEAATQGNWVAEGDDLFFNEDGYTKHLMETSEGTDICHDAEHPANLSFIAAARPATILALLAEIESTETRLHDVAVLCATVEQERDHLRVENERFDEGMRSTACTLGAGGYNAEHLNADELVAKVRWGIDYLCEAHERRMNELKAENEALRKDAERYRWLCSQGEDCPSHPFIVINDFDSTKKDVDEAIDAAMAKEASGD